MTTNFKLYINFKTAFLIILAVALCRIMPHPWNLAPMGAIALFGGASFRNSVFAFVIPFLALFLSDLFLNNFIYNELFHNQFTFFYPGAIFDYFAFGLIIVIGKFISRRISPLNITLTAISSALLFFVVSNFGVWISSGLYPKTLSGLSMCYAAGLPFLSNTIISDVFFSTLLFGVFSKEVSFQNVNTSSIGK